MSSYFGNALVRDFQAINWQSFFFMSINVFSSISIVLVNKWVYVTYNFNYATFLTLIHFILTFLGLVICEGMNVFESKKINVRDVIPLCLSFCGFVVFTNLSLQYNSVGFYQIMKVMTTPTLVFIQSNFYGETFDNKIKLSLIPICIGVSIVSATDVQLNMIGFFYSVLGVLVTSYYQIWVGTKQKELKVNAMQLLYYQAPISAAMLVLVIPVFDNIFSGDNPLIDYEMNVYAFMFIALSGILAFLVNLSIFLVIGKTSPVTYNVVGHFKLCIIIVSGFILFSYPVDSRNIFGIIVTLAGVFAYTHFKLEQQSHKAAADEAAKSNKIEAGNPRQN